MSWFYFIIHLLLWNADSLKWIYPYICIHTYMPIHMYIYIHIYHVHIYSTYKCFNNLFSLLKRKGELEYRNKAPSLRLTFSLQTAIFIQHFRRKTLILLPKVSGEWGVTWRVIARAYSSSARRWDILWIQWAIENDSFWFNPVPQRGRYQQMLCPLIMISQLTIVHGLFLNSVNMDFWIFKD